MTMANAQLLTNWTLVNAGNAATDAADTISDGIDTTITISKLNSIFMNQLVRQFHNNCQVNATIWSEPRPSGLS